MLGETLGWLSLHCICKLTEFKNFSLSSTLAKPDSIRGRNVSVQLSGEGRGVGGGGGERRWMRSAHYYTGANHRGLSWLCCWWLVSTSYLFSSVEKYINCFVDLLSEASWHQSPLLSPLFGIIALHPGAVVVMKVLLACKRSESCFFSSPPPPNN